MSLPAFGTFRSIAQERGVRPHQYDSFVGYTLIRHMSETERTGDHVLRLAREGRLSDDAATGLLRCLLDCYAEPLEHVGEVEEIQRELERYDE